MIRIVITTLLSLATLTVGGTWALGFLWPVSVLVWASTKLELRSSNGTFLAALRTPTDAQAGEVLNEITFAGLEYRDDLWDYGVDMPNRITRIQTLTLPGWPVVLVFAAYPGYVFSRALLRRRYGRQYPRER